MKLTLLILLLITFHGVAQTPLEAERKIDSIFSKYNADTPGVSVAIIRDGKIIFKKGYGSANLEYGVPITPGTVFHVASVSKQFTAFAIYLLEKQRKISFEDDLRKYFPDMPTYGKTIRIKHLLAHTSGLRDQWALLTLAGWQLEDVITTEQILKLATRQKELNFETGTAFGYCNTGFTLLSEIVKQVTGQSFAHFTRENIFEPLEMTSTQFYDDFHEIVKNRAYSYEKINGGYRKKELHYSNVGATSLLTTVEDLARWVGNFDKPTVGDAELIKEFNKASLLDDNTPVIWSARNGDTTYHAKGQLLWRHRGLRIISHGGHDAGFRAWLARFPENNFSIVTLSNDEHYEALKMGQPIVEIYLKDKLANIVTTDKLSHRDNNPTEKYRGNLKNFEGEYYSEELATGYTIKAQGDTLIMTHSRLSDTELTRIGKDKFSGVNSFTFEMEFLGNGKEITGFKISNFGAKNVKFARSK